MAGEWEKAVGAIVLAAFLDVMDGRIARLLKGQSRFGAELDSLSDVTAFGVAPAIILYQWMLSQLDPIGATHEYWRSEEHTSELQSLMRISYAVFCLKKKRTMKQHRIHKYLTRV